MYTILLSRRFKRSFKKLQKSGTLSSSAATDFKIIVATLKAGEKLPIIYRDHALTGDMWGYRECHIKGDLLLEYKKDDDRLIIDLIDIGSHSYLFG
ncbi:type II toxin-antitoxin system YafQ family toxin [Candidatus Kaiserbacteria bacterium]|nr:type II toxin-antitoxin system YafQ family toxin [Candidatus Kaiserbacteria bacterium]